MLCYNSSAICRFCKQKRTPRLSDWCRESGFPRKYQPGGGKTKEVFSNGSRINEAALKLALSSDEIIVNVQADEPFIEETVVKSVIERAKCTEAMITSACKKIELNYVKDPNLVKVILDVNGNAIYFSRSAIPYDREGGFEGYFGHLGIYAFRKKSLETFCTLPYAPIEHIEKLEQLRAIYHGYSIAMVEVESQSFGIDTKEDLERALTYFK